MHRSLWRRFTVPLAGIARTLARGQMLRQLEASLFRDAHIACRTPMLFRQSQRRSSAYRAMQYTSPKRHCLTLSTLPAARRYCFGNHSAAVQLTAQCAPPAQSVIIPRCSHCPPHADNVSAITAPPISASRAPDCAQPLHQLVCQRAHYHSRDRSRQHQHGQIAH